MQNEKDKKDANQYLEAFLEHDLSPLSSFFPAYTSLGRVGC
jgi:hypothetical protein